MKRLDGYDDIIEENQEWVADDEDPVEGEDPRDDVKSVQERIEKKRAEMDLWHGLHEMRAKMKVADEC